MSSKTSFFNKAVFLSDIKRFWWTALSEALLIALICVIPVYKSCSTTAVGIKPEWYSDIALPLLFGGGIAVLLFSYLHTSPPASTIHSYPITRTGLFTTKLISAVFLLISPVVINGIILAVLSLIPPCAGCFNVFDVLQWTYTGIIYTVIIFSLAASVGMMTGNSIATIVFTLGFIFLPVIFREYYEIILSEEFYGYTSYGIRDFLRYIYINTRNINKPEFVWIYPVYSAVFISLAYILYRIRKIEAHGEIIAFKWLKPVFIGIIAILASGFGYAYFGGILNIDSIFTIIPFGILGTAIAYMVSKKSLDFKGALKPAFIYMLCALCFGAAIEFDITGFEKRIPEADDILSVHISLPHERYSSYEYSTLPLYTDEESVKVIQKLHSKLISAKNQRKSGPKLYICYNLKSNTILEREYYVSFDEDEDLLKPLFETEEFRKKSFDLLSDRNKDFTSVEIYERRIPEGVITIYPDNPAMSELIDAVKKDMLSYSYEDYATRSTSTEISIFWNEENPRGKYEYSYHQSFGVTENTTNTNNMIERLLGDIKLPKADDIEKAVVTVSVNRELGAETEITVTDAVIIEELYSLYDDMIDGMKFTDYENATDVFIDYTLKNGHTFSVSCSYDYELLPEILKKYVK